MIPNPRLKQFDPRAIPIVKSNAPPQLHRVALPLAAGTVVGSAVFAQVGVMIPEDHLNLLFTTVMGVLGTRTFFSTFRR